MIEIVAEISGNHGGELGGAIQLIEAAKQAGANAVKLQLFDPDWLAKRRSHNIAVHIEANGRNLRNLYRSTWTPRDWFPTLKKVADDIGIEFYSSVFDPRDVSYLIDLGCKRLKIASFEAGDGELIRACCATGLPLIISTSLHFKMQQINSLISLLTTLGSTHRTTLLHATSYTGEAHDPLDLERVEAIAKKLSKKVKLGLSDHSGVESNPAAFMGLAEISMIEAHIKLPEVDTPDFDFSLLPKQFRKMVHLVRRTQRELASDVST